MAILSVKHKGLRRLIEAGDRKGFTREVADKLEDMLTVIHTARSVGDIEAYPGWKLHPLKGDLKGDLEPQGHPQLPADIPLQGGGRPRPGPGGLSLEQQKERPPWRWS